MKFERHEAVQYIACEINGMGEGVRGKYLGLYIRLPEPENSRAEVKFTYSRDADAVQVVTLIRAIQDAGFTPGVLPFPHNHHADVFVRGGADDVKAFLEIVLPRLTSRFWTNKFKEVLGNA